MLDFGSMTTAAFRIVLSFSDIGVARVSDETKGLEK
jgi:hypothetical protein